MAKRKKKKVTKKKAATRKKRPNPAEQKLTPKQLLFVNYYCSDAVKFNATKAAKLAGYKGGESTIRSVASENLTKPNIAAEIERRRVLALSGVGVTIETTLNKVLTVYEKALVAGKYAPALRAAELLGKHLKMWTDRIEHVEDVEEMTLPQLNALLKEIVEAGNVDISKLLADNGSGNGGGSNPSPNKTTH